jgi:hypothetical protein
MLPYLSLAITTIQVHEASAMPAGTAIGDKVGPGAPRDPAALYVVSPASVIRSPTEPLAC